MSGPVTRRWWSTRRLPNGELELTVKSSALSDARLRPGIIAFGAFAAGGLALLNDPPLPVITAVGWALGVFLLAYARKHGRTQVWWLKPGMATLSPGRKEEAAYFVSEVHLEHAVDSDGEHHWTLELVTPAKRIEVGPMYHPEPDLRGMGRAMAEALEVPFRDARP